MVEAGGTAAAAVTAEADTNPVLTAPIWRTRIGAVNAIVKSVHTSRRSKQDRLSVGNHNHVFAVSR